MSKESYMEEIVNSLEVHGWITLAGNGEMIMIESIDDKEGYSYVTTGGREFDSAEDAVEWVMHRFSGPENTMIWDKG